MRRLKFLVILALLALLGGWTAFGQEVSTPLLNCAEFQNGSRSDTCVWTSSDEQITLGKGRKLTLTATNSWSSTHRIQLGVVFSTTPSQWESGVWSLATFYTFTDKWGNVSSGSAMGVTVWLDPGQTGVISFQAAKGCDVHGQNCQKEPDSEITVSGLVRFGLLGASSEVLRGLKSPVLETKDTQTGTITRMTLEQSEIPVATIKTTPSSGSVGVSWSSSIAGPVVRVYRNGSFLWNQTLKGSETDWSVPSGANQYCIRAVNPDWSESGDLACSMAVIQ